MSVVYPMTLDLADLAHEYHPNCVGWLTHRRPADGCALCRIGCCIQLISIGVDEPIEVHGVLGDG